MLYTKERLDMKKEIRCLICIIIGIICVSVWLAIIRMTDNQKKYELDTTTKTTANIIFQEITETTEESTTEETMTEESTIKETTVKETTTKEEINKGQSDYVDYDVPSNNTMKTYMDYKTITSTSSKQYKLQKSLAYTDSKGLRMVGDRYCVAVGSYYTTTIGQYIDVELENGKIIKCILADCKDDRHTDSTNRINPNGSVVEFVVDTDVLDSTAKKMGDISHINGWNSRVVNIKVYDKVEEF